MSGVITFYEKINLKDIMKVSCLWTTLRWIKTRFPVLHFAFCIVWSDGESINQGEWGECHWNLGNNLPPLLKSVFSAKELWPRFYAKVEIEKVQNHIFPFHNFPPHNIVNLKKGAILAAYLQTIIIFSRS